MTIFNFTANGAVLTAIDISKYRYEVLIAVPGKKRKRRVTLISPVWPEQENRTKLSLLAVDINNIYKYYFS